MAGDSITARPVSLVTRQSHRGNDRDLRLLGISLSIPQLGDETMACRKLNIAAHQAVSTAHNFPPEQPSVEYAIGMMNFKLSDPYAYGIVAERDGAIVGSAFLTSFPPAPVAAIGPLTVQPSHEGKVGRRLMEAVLERAQAERFEGVRLAR